MEVSFPLSFNLIGELWRLVFRFPSILLVSYGGGIAGICPFAKILEEYTPLLFPYYSALCSSFMMYSVEGVRTVRHGNASDVRCQMILVE